MKHTLKMISLAALLLLFACQKEKNPVSGTISGNLSSYDPATPLVKTPLEGIKLWLVNADFKFDTVTFAGNRAAIVDSTFSDANGNYRFASIPLGNYYVSPFPDTAGYQFEPVPEGNTAPLTISEASPDQSLSFSSPWPGGDNSKFYVTITVYNATAGDYYIWQRQQFIFFIPFFSTAQGSNGPYHFGPATTTWNFLYGITFVGYTMTNNFLLDFYHSNGQWFDSYWIVQDLGNTPSASAWEIDLNAHTITRTSP